MWTTELLARYLEGESLEIVLEHSRHVADLALEVARQQMLSEHDCRFIEEAALLHDIGVCRVHAPSLGLYGPHPYIMHGVLGREILEREGYPLHALVCERHTGVGLTLDDIIRQDLPLPHREMCPGVTCRADYLFCRPVLLQETGQAGRAQIRGAGEKKTAPVR